MFKSTINCSSGSPISMFLPSPAELRGNPDSIFRSSVTVRDHCEITTHLCTHDNSIIMYGSCNVLKDCTIENYRTDERALVFSVVTGGSACEIIGNQHVEHGEGAVNMGIVPSSNTHMLQLAAGSHFEKITIMISESDFNIYNERYPIIFSGFKGLLASDRPFVDEVIDTNGKILEAARDIQNSVFSKSVNPFFVEGLVVECLVNYYYEQFHTPLPDNYTVCRKIFQARKVLNENFQNPPSLRELAATVGTNECTLKKVFKQVFSMTVFDYVNDLRMNKAARLLSDTSDSISNIASLLGFSSQSHFSTAFRKNYGLSPKEFRDSCLHPTQTAVPD